MDSTAIIDSRLHVKHDLGDALGRNVSFFSDTRRLGHFANQLLIYDCVIVPTNDFAIVPALIGWLGLTNFEEALECRAIRFIHRDSLLGYVGNGVGVSGLSIQPGPEPGIGQFHYWWQHALFGPPADALALQLRERGPSLSASQQKTLVDRVLAVTQTARFNNEFFMRNIAHESYRDIQNSPELSTLVANLARRAGYTGAELDLQRLPGLTATQVQVAGDGDYLSSADLVVRIAETNMEIVLADLADGADLHVSEGAETILKRKLLTSGKYLVPDAFGRILELNGIPDIRDVVVAGTVSVSDIWKLRQRRLASEFRSWLRQADVDDARELERMYVRSLEGAGIESAPVRVLRFALTSIVGVLATLPGLAISGADSFFVSKFLGGFRPKLMLDELRKLALS